VPVTEFHLEWPRIWPKLRRAVGHIGGVYKGCVVCVIDESGEEMARMAIEGEVVERERLTVAVRQPLDSGDNSVDEAIQRDAHKSQDARRQLSFQTTRRHLLTPSWTGASFPPVSAGQRSGRWAGAPHTPSTKSLPSRRWLQFIPTGFGPKFLGTPRVPRDLPFQVNVGANSVTAKTFLARGEATPGQRGQGGTCQTSARLCAGLFARGELQEAGPATWRKKRAAGHRSESYNSRS
jgi:hypothetical protein